MRRRLINEAQRHAATGKIEADILCDIADVKDRCQLMNSLKNKEFSTVRKWVVDNIDNDPNIIMRKIFDAIYEQHQTQDTFQK